MAKVFLFQSNRQADPSRCPPWPDGFPVVMLDYDYWAETRNWPPEVVRRLRRDELFWLPVITTAKRDAAEQLRAAEKD